MQLIIFGSPGVGKGTLSDMLSNKYKIPHISTGDIFRNEIKSGNSELMQYVEKGLLVPDSVVNKVTENGLKQDRCKDGFILDGYPRTIDQAEFLDNILWKLNKKMDIVLNLAASDTLVIERLSQRRVCGKCGATYNLITLKPKKKNVCDKCGSPLVQRQDDEPETVKKRIEVYRQETIQVIDYYKKKKILVDIDAAKKPKDVFNVIVKVVEDKFLDKTKKDSSNKK